MIEIFKKAAELPRAWDNIFRDSSYLSREQLEILEICNPCSQRYVIINKRSAFIVYELRLNIFSYSKMDLKLSVNIIGIPCSVSRQGYKIEAGDIRELEDYIKEEKKSFLVLNSGDKFLSNCFAMGETLSTCSLQIAWDSFDDYMLSLRSHYRYRLGRALKKGNSAVIKKLTDNSMFSEKMYSLYLNVYEKSDYKLEKLSIDFFRRMPSSIYVFYIQDEPAAFVQLGSGNEELFFIFGGIDYSLNHEYDLYINMLLFILKYGIENKYVSIDMGQTAEDAKMKLGCSLTKKYMHIYHPNCIVRFFIKLFSKKLSYNSPDLKFNLFKGES